ncbi:MAG: selenium-dependent xanthine dehydrogenase [Tepidisphaeraceae bacterium]
MSTSSPSDVARRDASSVEFLLNGRAVRVDAIDTRSLLSIVREDFGLTSIKNGCEPQASCGCCTLLVDGKPRLACTLKAPQVAGKEVITLEGLPDETRQLLAKSFVNTGGVQCGFCIPGIAMRGHALVQADKHPTREKITHELRGHLCRCTGYTKVIDAVAEYAVRKRGETVAVPEQSGKVGTSLDRFRGNDLVLGDFKYVDDVFIEGSLYAGLRFSDHPRARVKSIDASEALATPGVERVITAADVPGDRVVGLIVKDWPVLVAVGEETRCIGDVLAVVVASDQHTVRTAAAKVRVEYDVLEPVTSPDDALKPGSPRVHAKGNLLSKSSLHRGDVDAALAASAHVVEDIFQTQRIEHMFLEPEACVAIPSTGDDGQMRLRVLSQGQGVFDDQRQIASLLGWDKSRVQVDLHQCGGAFGGKEDMTIQGQTALAAALCGKPVKCTLTRRESFRLHPKRHAIRIHMKVGCDAEGKLTAVWARMIGDKGAYASVGAKVLERAAGHACGPYRVPNIDVESLAVYTNNPPCGAMRGFGANQAAFAVESLINRLADKVGIDGWEIRWRNALEQGDRFSTGQKLDKPFGLKKTLLAVRDAYRGAKFAGIACGVKNVGIGNGMPDPGRCVMRVNDDGTVSIRTGFTEMGQGYFTVLIQAACEETGLPPETFRPTTDTSVDVNSGQTTASRATVLGCHAVALAAKKLKADLAAGKTLRDLAGREYRGEWVCNDTTKLEANVPEPKTHLTYGWATQVVILNDAGGIEKVIAAHDVGRVMNRTLLEGQMQGSIHMGLGYALSEEFVVDNGQLVTDTVKSVGVLRAHQMPAVECIFVEEPDPETAYGSRGVGEIGLVPTAPAVAAAMEKFDGVRRTTLPMKDSPAARAMGIRPGRAT